MTNHQEHDKTEPTRMAEQIKHKKIIMGLIIYFILYFILGIIPFYYFFSPSSVFVKIFYSFMRVLSMGNQILIIVLLFIAYKFVTQCIEPKAYSEEMNNPQQPEQDAASDGEPEPIVIEPKKKPLKPFFMLFIGLLCLSGFLGISVLGSSMGSGSWENLRLLFSTLITDFYLLLSLAHIRQLHRKEKLYSLFNWTSLGINILGLLFSYSLIWDSFSSIDEITTKIFAYFMIISFSLAHIALMISITPRTSMVKWLLGTSLFFIIINAFYMLFLVAGINHVNGDSFLFLAILSILVVLGSIITPLVNKMETA